jgi:hypothetical protein
MSLNVVIIMLYATFNYGASKRFLKMVLAYQTTRL